MDNKKKYNQIFIETFSIDESKLGESLEYNSIPEWDSIGHMGLIASLEEAYDITMEMDDIRGQFQEAYQRFMNSPMKEDDMRRYEKDYMELKQIVSRLGLQGETEMDAEHGAAAQDKRRYKFKL